MENIKYQVYIAWSRKKYRIFISPNPASDLSYLKKGGYQEGLFLSPPLAFGRAYFLWQKLSSEEERRGKVLREKRGIFVKLGSLFGLGTTNINSLISKKKAKAKRLLASLRVKAFKPGKIDSLAHEDLTKVSTELKSLLKGRILLPREVEQLLQEREFTYGPLTPLLQKLWLEGSLSLIPAIEETKEGHLCNRCGQSNKVTKIHCANCLEECFHCEECINMGEAKACLPLVAVKEEGIRQIPREKISYKLDFELTTAQLAAGKKVRDFYTSYKKDQPKICLVWAVCGAGKTEVSFGAITEALNKGEKVLFAIPRRDVVMELEPRLKSAFPGVKITTLFGGSNTKFEDAQITIATTHQALRFYQAFSLVVLDEADAYPYQGSEMLYFALEQARKATGKVVYMTATPSKDLLSLVAKGKALKVTIPARHHRHPLPMPKVQLSKALGQDKDKPLNLPTEVLAWLHKMAEGEKGQVFIFVPTISLAEKVGETLKEALSKPPYNLPPTWTEYSHSKDSKRDEKREAFKKGAFPFFVTTSIMERGITVPRAKVLVLFADYEKIFDQGALIQMAGRSGRLDSDPMGEVLFLAKKETEAIKGTLKIISVMNEEGKVKGYLKC